MVVKNERWCHFVENGEMVRMKRADHKFEDQWREADSAIKAPVFLLSIFGLKI